MRDHPALLAKEIAAILDNSSAAVHDRAVTVYHTFLTQTVSFHFDTRGRLRHRQDPCAVRE